MTELIEIPASRIEHPGATFYTFLLDSETLLHIAYVSADERDKGTQRPLSETRCKSVAKFIDSSDGLFANNIILNLPEQTEFLPSAENAIYGTIRIPKTKNSAWIVDGQHRLYGFNYANNKYILLCTAFINLDIPHQTQIFITINKEQKGISTSVIYDLLSLTKNAEYKKERSHDLVKRFNDDPDSPWFNEIKMLGVGKGLVSQAAFAQNLEKLIEPNGGRLTSYSEEIQFAILNNYFRAFKALFSEEWGSNKYVLTKAVGLSAMCGIFPKVHELCNNDLTIENIMKQIDNLKDFDFSSSTLGKSTNRVAIESIVQILLEKLPDIETVKNIKI